LFVPWYLNTLRIFTSPSVFSVGQAKQEAGGRVNGVSGTLPACSVPRFFREKFKESENYGKIPAGYRCFFIAFCTFKITSAVKTGI
jgi:hypothetical protein